MSFKTPLILSTDVDQSFLGDFDDFDLDFHWDHFFICFHSSDENHQEAAFLKLLFSLLSIYLDFENCFLFLVPKGL